MATVEFEGNRLGPAVRVDVPEGGRLLDACDDSSAPVAFSCRSASCGTCRVAVLCGQEFLRPPAQDELDVLEIFAAPPTERLACQAVVVATQGLVRLRWVDDDGL